MKRLNHFILMGALLMGALCPLYLLADVDTWNGTSWSNVDKFNGTSSANIDKLNGETASSGGACTPSNDVVIESCSAHSTYNTFGSTYKHAQGFTHTANFSETVLECYCSDGEATSDLTIEIYDDNSGEPGSPIANTSVSFTDGEIPDAATPGIISKALAATWTSGVANTQYYIVFSTTSNIRIYYTDSNVYSGTNNHTFLWGGSSWTHYDSLDTEFKIYGCPR